jgi:Tfp pilus assembly protein PilF
MLAGAQNNKKAATMKNKALALCIALALSGCSAGPIGELQATLKEVLVSLLQSRGQAALRHAVQQYESGQYAAAEEALHQALEHGLEPADRVVAHKTLAFINCATERMQECRAQFQLALRADPRTDLDPAEAGHPAWGPVFRSLPR